MATNNSGVSSSDATAGQKGNVSIIRQGQTAGYLGNDPYVATIASDKNKQATPLKP